MRVPLACDLRQRPRHLAARRILAVSLLAIPVLLFTARTVVSSDATPALDRAEELLTVAEDGRLTDGLAADAARLLTHDDPFVRALAEWAIATRVERDNAGQQAVWPGKKPPAWFTAWIGLGCDFLLEADYARQAIVWGIHRNSTGLRDSAGKIVRRAEGTASDVVGSDSDPATIREVADRLAEVKTLRDRLAESVASKPDDLAHHRRLWLDIRTATRRIVLANPALDFDRLVFVKRHSAHTHRNITGSQYSWVHKPGGDICVKTGFEPGGEIRHVLDGRLGPGHVHGMDLWWDADRIVFGYARQPDWPPAWDTASGDHVFKLRLQQEPTHVFEIRLDGTALRQLTDHPHFNDFEPTYCANGDVVFVSGRSGRSSECGKFSADHTVLNLYRVTPGQDSVRRLNDNKDIDRYPHSLDNGLIAYTRWDYQERHFMETHAIWTMRPDGTQADAVFNQHLRAPYGLRDVRSVPGGNKLVAIATGHHTFAYGPVVLIDPGRGINSEESIRVVTPHVTPQEGPMSGQPVTEGGVPVRGGLYQTPWALTDKCFLVSYSYARKLGGTQGGGNAAGFAVYLIDVYGNKELVHRDPLLSSTFPMPVRPRPCPPKLPRMTQPTAKQATAYVADVYHDLPGIGRGTVKYLRISQRVGWPLDEKIGAMRYIPGNAWEGKFGHWNWAPVRVVGEVEVNQDGSACFTVPAEAALYFQALDNRHMEVRRMRSHVTFQPGERRGCVGCHESQLKTPTADWSHPAALRQPPQTPKPPPWGADRLLGYEWLVQPVLDQHCVRCHGAVDPDGGLDFTAGDTDDDFYRSFHTIFANPSQTGDKNGRLVSIADRRSNASVSRPVEFGSHRSRFIRVLLDDKLHRDEVELSDNQWLALVTWVDANAPYHDKFYDRRPVDGGQPRRDISLEQPVARSSPGTP